MSQNAVVSEQVCKRINFHTFAQRHKLQLYLYLFLRGGLRSALRPSINCGPMRNRPRQHKLHINQQSYRFWNSWYRRISSFNAVACKSLCYTVSLSLRSSVFAFHQTTSNTS